MPEVADKKNKDGGDGSTLAAVLEKKSERIPYEVLEEEKIPGSRVRFKLKLTEEALAPRLDETIKEFSRNITVQGFRPGKAPKDLVRRRYEGPAREETVKRMVDRLCEIYAEDKGYETIGDHYLLEFSSKREEGTTVELAIEVHPEIKITDETLSDLKAEIHRVKVDDAYVEKSLQNLREQNATYEATDEGFQPKDGLLFNCTVTDSQGDEIADRCVQSYYSTKVEEELPEAVAAAVAGKKKGEKISLDVTEDVEGADAGTIETVHYDLEILEVKRRLLPELDDEFARDVNEKFENLEDLRKATVEGAAKQEEGRQREEALNKIYEVLRERLEFDLPRAMVEGTANRSISDMEKRLNQYGISLRSMDQAIVQNYAASMKEQAKQNVKNYLVLRAVGKFVDAKPSEEQINEALDNMAKSSGRKPLAVRAQLEAKKQWGQFIEDLTMKVTNDELLKRATVSHTDVTIDELSEIQRKAQEDQAAKLRGE